MAYDDSRLGDYNEVAARLAEFRAKHPDGSLQPADIGNPFTIQEIGGQLHIVVVAAAYRSPEDPRPGIGMAYEVFPGRTPYTKGSELQNAETSAWGRAIVAALAADTKKGIASAEEIRNRQAERDVQAPARSAGVKSRPMTETQRKEMFTLFKDLGRNSRDDQITYLSWITGREITSRKDLDINEARHAIADLRRRFKEEKEEEDILHTGPEPHGEQAAYDLR